MASAGHKWSARLDSDRRSGSRGASTRSAAWHLHGASRCHPGVDQAGGDEGGLQPLDHVGGVPSATSTRRHRAPARSAAQAPATGRLHQQPAARGGSSSSTGRRAPRPAGAPLTLGLGAPPPRRASVAAGRPAASTASTRPPARRRRFHRCPPRGSASDRVGPAAAAACSPSPVDPSVLGRTGAGSATPVRAVVTSGGHRHPPGRRHRGSVDRTGGAGDARSPRRRPSRLASREPGHLSGRQPTLPWQQAAHCAASTRHSSVNDGIDARTSHHRLRWVFLSSSRVATRRQRRGELVDPSASGVELGGAASRRSTARVVRQQPADLGDAAWRAPRPRLAAGAGLLGAGGRVGRLNHAGEGSRVRRRHWPPSP